MCPPHLPAVPAWHGAGFPIILGGCSNGTLACSPGSRLGDPGAPSLPWQRTLRALVPQDGDRVAFHPPADLRVPLCPTCPASPRRCLCVGAGGRQGGGGILAGASLNLASVECHLTQTVCASLSPYQPFCSSHLRGGGRSVFGRSRSRCSPRSLQPPLPSLLPPGCWESRPMLLQPGSWG